MGRSHFFPYTGSTRPVARHSGSTAPLTAFRVVEELSKADGSVGWCAMIAIALSLNAGRLPAVVGRELAGTPADYRGAGSARRGGKAWEVPGGYRVKGRWNFAKLPALTFLVPSAGFGTR